jgi:ABC-type transport system involved in multi-copper enzyme maturation permease subunit
MLWYKSWLDTRWRFLIGFGLLVMSAAGVILDYRATAALMPLAGAIDTSGPLGRVIKQAMDVQRDFRGFVWFQWFHQNLANMGTLFAVLLGSGSVLSYGPERSALFTLSLPVSRTRIVGVRAATGLAELLVLAVIPSLVIPLLSPSVGQTYSVGAALVHGMCLFAAAAVFFSLALLLSTVFTDLWRPLLLSCAMAVALSAAGFAFPELQPYGIFRVMSGEIYFQTGHLPWAGLIVSAASAAALLCGAAVNVARLDF